VSTQNPVRLPPDSEPQPDGLLLKPRADRYRDTLPGATDVLLLIEVADTTVRYDREVKLALYARHRIAEVWLVDLADDRLTIYREPRGDVYRESLRPERGAASRHACWKKRDCR
jgi:Uma2 family endonuclease